MSGQEDCGLRRSRKPVAPPGRSSFFSFVPWGSRPRLNICRASGAQFRNRRPTRISSGDNGEIAPSSNLGDCSGWVGELTADGYALPAATGSAATKAATTAGETTAGESATSAATDEWAPKGTAPCPGAASDRGLWPYET